MILHLLCLWFTVSGATGGCLGVLDLSTSFYPTNKHIAKDLVDSTRPRPNERLDLPVKFPFLGNHLCEGQEWWVDGPDCVNVEGFSSVWVNKNGILSFGDEWRDPFLNSFARSLSFPAISPLWGLLGFSDKSSVQYYQTDQGVLLNQAKADITGAFTCAAGFEPTLVAVITWYKMDIDQACATEGRAWCDCLVRNFPEYCVCDALPINEYCACVAADDPEVCECVTEVPERTPHCECLLTRSSDYCVCVFENGFSEDFCDCVEETGNPDYCSCLDYSYYGADYCECVHIDGGDYYDCIPDDDRKKRDVEEQMVEPLKNEGRVRNKREGADMDDLHSSSTFQAVLVTDGTQSYVIFNYESIEIQDLFGTFQGIVGFDGGMRGFPFGPEFNHQFSYSFDLKSVITESNVAVPGKWIYRVDGDTVLEPGDC